MKSSFTTRVLAITLLATITIPAGLAAQEHLQTPRHHHYKLIDLGTLGGLQSGEFEENQTGTAYDTRMINAQGVVTGGAELSVSDPYNVCLTGASCGLVHGFLWQRGEMSDLGALPGANDTIANWINDQGHVAGASFNGVDPGSGAPLLEAVLWRNGKVIDLGGLPGGNQGIANAINGRDEVVGAAVNGTPDPFPNLWGFLFYTNSTEVHAVRWRDGVVTDLGTLGGPDSTAIFVNDSGQIAGQSLTDPTANPATGQPTQHPFLWQNGKMLDLGTLGGTFGFPTDLNEHGQVVGLMNLAGDLIFHPFLWDRGSLTDLGTLGGDYGYASWINNHGVVVGAANLAGNQTGHAFLWKNGEMTDLGTPGGDPCTDASVINLRGQVVGISSDCQGNFLHAFLWEDGGPMVDLQSLIVNASDLTVGDNISINDRGEIVANGFLPNGDIHAILLIPCDDSHPDVEDCDFGLVQTSNSQAKPFPSIRPHASLGRRSGALPPRAPWFLRRRASANDR